jgi:hypothetical protein
VIVNELAQWAALLFVAVLVVGLTRQLGNFLIPRHEQLALDVGPRVGRKLPGDLLSPDEHRQVLDLIQERRTGWAAFLVVSEGCPGCKDLLERLESTGAPQRAPVIALSRKSGEEHVTALRAATDLVIVDGARLKAAGLTITPFAMIVDRSMTVLHKQLAWDLAEVVAAWRQERGGHRPATEDHYAPDEPPAVTRM